jgi:O-antigen/teichoic acid export membrane protein
VTAESDKDLSIQRRVALGTASNYAGQLVAFASLFFLTPFVLQHLGPTVYGLWVLIGSLLAFGSVLDFGFWGAIIKYVAEYRARGENGTVRTLLATALCLYVVMGVAVVILAAGAAAIIPTAFNLPVDQRGLASELILIMGFGVGISLPGMMPLSILRGLQRYDIVNLVEITATLVTTAATIAGLLSRGGVHSVVLANLLGVFVMALLGAWFVRRIAPEISFGWRDANRGMARHIIAFSWPLSVKDIASRLQTRSDEITIGAFLPITAIAPYNLSRRLSETTYVLTRQFMKVLLPLASELHAQNDLARLRQVYTSGTRVTLALSLGIGGTLIVLARPILTVWVGPEYASAGGLVAILTLASFLAAALWPAGAVLQGVGRHRLLAATSLGAGLANLALSIVLVRPFGVTGVALGTLIPAVVEFFIIVPFTMRLLRVSAATAVAEVLAPIVGPTALMVLVLYGLRQVFQPAALLPLLIIAVAGMAVFAVAYLGLGASAAERGTYRDLAYGAFRFARARLNRADLPNDRGHTPGAVT